MTIALLCSQADPASVNIRDRLREMESWAYVPEHVHGLPMHEAPGLVLFETPKLHLECDLVDEELRRALRRDFDAVLVLSKHKAASGKPALTTHPIGNFNAADFGGRPREVTPAAPAVMTRVLRALAEGARDAGLKHDVTFEATHHGPHLETPTAFVEIGTDEAAWSDPALGRVVARAVLHAAGAPAVVPRDTPVLIGVGGSHYAPRVTDLALKRRVAFGHLIPGYQVDAGVDADVVRQVVERTPGATGYYLDERGFKGDAAHVTDALEAAGLQRVREDDLALLDA